MKKQIIILIGVLLFFGSCRKKINKTNPEFVGVWVNSDWKREIIIEESGTAEIVDYEVNRDHDYDYSMRGRADIQPSESGIDRLRIKPSLSDKLSLKKIYRSTISVFPTEVDTPMVYDWPYIRSLNTCEACTTFTFWRSGTGSIWYKIE